MSKDAETVNIQTVGIEGKDSPLISLHHYLAVLVLGFSSGLPLALTGTAMQAWLVLDGITIATIALFGLVGIPYTFKFIWAPLMDRFDIPLLGRRRGWVIVCQLLLAVTLFIMSNVSPKDNTITFALIAVIIAFFSASQDVVIDAYRTDLLAPKERGMGAGLNVLGYRLAMIVSGALPLTWVDKNSYNWSWSHVYQIMAVFMIAAACVTFFLLPTLPKHVQAPKTDRKHDLLGFAALLIAVVIGYQITYQLIKPLFTALFHVSEVAGNKKWADLLTVLSGVSITIPIGIWAAKIAKFETLNRSMKSYFSMNHAVTFLVLVILYKLGDAFAGALLTPFLLKVIGFPPAEVGVVNKLLGMWITILGIIAGGALMSKIGLYKSLLLFGILQLISNFGFWLVAISTKGAWGGFTLPAFNWGIIMLKEATLVDYQLLLVIALENSTGGMGTAALVALLMALCNQRFTATHYALLSALAAIGRVWVGPSSGVLTEVIGWPAFFILSAVMAVPGLVMLAWLKKDVSALDAPKVNLDADD